MVIVMLETVPSGSVPVRGGNRIGPFCEDMFGATTGEAVGGVLPTGIVTVAGLESVRPLLSVAVKVKVALPVKVGAGSNFKLEAWARVRICPTVTGVTPSARYSTPCAAVGRLETV